MTGGIARVMRAIAVVGAVVVFVAGVALNWLLLDELYGSGPPYYGRTTNMDKWTSPWPDLAILDAMLLVVVAGLLFYARRRPRLG